jgi:hypothetical protein
VEGTSNGGRSVGYTASIWWKEPPMVEGALDMPPRFGERNLQWWRERWICRLDLVEGTSNAASIWWKKPQITTTSTSMGGSPKVVVEEVTIGCYQQPSEQSLYLNLNLTKTETLKKSEILNSNAPNRHGCLRFRLEENQKPNMDL